MPRRRSSRTSSRKASTRKRSRLGRRSFRRRVHRRVPIKDIYHYTETINGGTIIINSTNYNQTTAAGGVWILRLSDFPIFQRFVNCYEFARLNKCSIEFIPKANMQLNQGNGTTFTNSITGTLITAIDQIPIFSAAGFASGVLATAPTWENDGSNDTNITSPAPALCGQMTPSYVRGLQGSHERELYKRQLRSFYPAFYTPVLDLATTNTGQTIGSQVSSTGCFERNVKKWVNINSIQTAVPAGTSTLIVPNNGPLYYGPVYALDVNSTQTGEQTITQLFDVRLRYSMSFKRLKGSVANNV